MAEPPKRDAKLSRRIIEEFRRAGQRGDVSAFKRLLGTYGSHLPSSVKNRLVEDFKRNAALLQDALREE
jgi:hypothetical protein